MEKVNKYNFDFVGNFKTFGGISLFLVLGSLVLLATKGLNFGVDFRGGAEVQVQFKNSIQLDIIRSKLETNFSSSVVQSLGDENSGAFLIKVSDQGKDLNVTTQDLVNTIEKDLKEFSPSIEKTDIVGPKAGEQLRNSAFQAMAWALLAIMIYVGLRFDYKYAPGGIAALVHDVIITLGVFSLTGKEFSLQVVGALLAIIGYSINDTVVIYDRLREYEENLGANVPFKSIINDATNDTLSRTILTVITVLIVSVSMLIWGGSVIHDFFFTMTFGLVVGTYSSIFVAAPSILIFEKIKIGKN
jgi:preprotein translocase subunit SecF